MTIIPDDDEGLTRVLHRLQHQVGAGGRISAHVDRLQLVGGHARAAASLATGSGAVLNATIAAMLSVARVEPLAGLDSRYLAVAFARELAEVNGFAYRPQVRLADLGGLDLKDDNLSAQQPIDDRLAARIISMATGLPPADLHDRGMVLSEPIRAFLGGAVSHLPHETTRRLEHVAGVVQDRLLRVGVRTEVALSQSNPGYDHDPDPYDPKVGLSDEVTIARSDCLIAFHDRPSTGLGIDVAHAQSTRAFTVFIERSMLRSPNAACIGYPFDVVDLGAVTPIEDLDAVELDELSEAIAAKIQTIVTDQMVRFEVHRRERLRRVHAYGKEHADLVVALSGLTPTARAQLPVPHARLIQLEASLDLYAVAPREEQDLVREALGIGGLDDDRTGTRGPLTADEYAAALEAKRSFRYSEEQLAELLESVSSQILVGHHRADLTDPVVWDGLRTQPLS